MRHPGRSTHHCAWWSRSPQGTRGTFSPWRACQTLEENGMREIGCDLRTPLPFLLRLGTTKEGTGFLPRLPVRGPEVTASPHAPSALLPAPRQALAGLSLLEVLSDQGIQQHQEHQGNPSLPETD